MIYRPADAPVGFACTCASKLEASFRESMRARALPEDRCGPKVPAFLQTWFKVRLLKSFVGVRVTNVLPMRESGHEAQATDLTLEP